jgi:hypothetical protein
MTTAARQRELPRRTLAVLAALVTVLATFGLAAPASASTSMSSTSVSGSTTRVAETRVGASTPVVEHVVGVAEHIGAGQRLGEQPAGLVSASATGVAAKTADDWPILSGIVRDAGTGKGNFGLGSGTASQATRAGESWVGEGYRIASDGRTLVSSDGLRTFRPPTWKPNEGKYQANFEYWIGERVGKPFGNGHLDITDMFP